MQRLFVALLYPISPRQFLFFLFLFGGAFRSCCGCLDNGTSVLQHVRVTAAAAPLLFWLPYPHCYCSLPRITYHKLIRMLPHEGLIDVIDSSPVA